MRLLLIISLGMAVVTVPISDAMASEYELRSQLNKQKDASRKIPEGCQELHKTAGKVLRSVAKHKNPPSRIRSALGTIRSIKSALANICPDLRRYGSKMRTWIGKIYNHCLRCLGAGKCNGSSASSKRSHFNKCKSRVDTLSDVGKDFGRYQKRLIAQHRRWKKVTKQLQSAIKAANKKIRKRRK